MNLTTERELDGHTRCCADQCSGQRRAANRL